MKNGHPMNVYSMESITKRANTLTDIKNERYLHSIKNLGHGEHSYTHTIAQFFNKSELYYLATLLSTEIFNG